MILQKKVKLHKQSKETVVVTVPKQFKEALSWDIGQPLQVSLDTNTKQLIVESVKV